MLKKLLFLLLIVLLTLSLPAMAEEEVILGRLTKLGVDEDTLNEAISDVFFSLVPFSRYQFFDTLNSMVLALNSKAIAGLQVDEFTAKYLMSRNENFVEFKTSAAPPYLLDYSMLLREENAELRDSISAAIEDMRADGTLDALKQQYIDNVIAGTEPDAIPVEKFVGAETIKVALTGDRPPMDYFSAAGEPIGFNTALLSEVGKRLGKNVEFVSIDTGARTVSLSSGASDIVFWSEAGNFDNWDGADTEDQPENTVVTKPYLTGLITYVVLAGSPEAALSED